MDDELLKTLKEILNKLDDINLTYRELDNFWKENQNALYDSVSCANGNKDLIASLVSESKFILSGINSGSSRDDDNETLKELYDNVRKLSISCNEYKDLSKEAYEKINESNRIMADLSMNLSSIERLIEKIKSSLSD